MDQGLKERLIGAAVLVALAVWLVPWLLDGPDEPITADGATLELPVPSGHVGEIRTEVIDLAPRREGSRPTGAGSGRAADAASARPAEPSGRDAAATTVDRSAVTAEAAPTTGGSDGSQSTQDAARTSVAASTAPASSDPAPAGQRSTSTESRTSGAAPSSGSSAPAASTRSASTARAAPAESGDWAVQVGSFSEEENARRHADRVSALGYSPKISTFRAGGRVMYRVRVGPHATRQAAEAVASALAAHGFVAQVVTAN